MYDLRCPEGKRPLFAQTYMLTPEDAVELREQNITGALGKKISKEIMETLENLMRQNPFGRTFMTAGEKVKEAMEMNGNELPRFKV